MAAAVSDWRPKSYSARKIKRRLVKRERVLRLVENPDILKTLGDNKRYILVGFALETEDLETNAIRKLKNKNLDIIVANRLRNGIGPFGGGKTDILIIDRTGARKAYKARTKRDLAKIILDKAFGFKIK
jgi:phosphopantothenoylcysteine decarboxylase/phosphopantothenate--cysteine ligase